VALSSTLYYKVNSSECLPREREADPFCCYPPAMPLTPNTDVTIRVATKHDAPAAGKICFDAFTAISNAHNFPPDLPSAEVSIGLMSTLFSVPGFYCVVAEIGGRISGAIAWMSVR